MTKTYPLTIEQVKGVLNGSITAFRMPIVGLEEGEDYKIQYYDRDNSYQLLWNDDGDYRYVGYVNPPYQQGDIVKGLEEWIYGHYYDKGDIWYKADFEHKKEYAGWHPANTMPPEFSRITFEITEVKVQKLGDMTREEMREDGARLPPSPRFSPEGDRSELHQEYECVWNTLHPDHPYDPELWTFVNEFKLLEGESDD